MTLEFTLKKKIKVAESSQLFDIRFNSANHDLVAAGTIEGDVILYDLSKEDSRPSTILKKHHKGTPIRKILFDTAGKLITAAKTVKVYDLESSSLVRTLKRNVDTQSKLYSMLMMTDDVICAGDDEGSFLAWDLRRPVDQPIMSLKYCEEYLSGMDKDENDNLILTTSFDSRLTVFDIRARKKVDPQSEVFEAGFQCIKYVRLNQKAVVGAEDGSIYIFNQNEWGYMQSKFPVAKETQRARGKSSIECMDILEGTTLLIGCSDGKLKLVNLYPHKVINECVYSHKNSIEALHVLQDDEILATCEENIINILSFRHEEQKGDVEAGKSSDSDLDDSEDSDDSNGKKKNKRLKLSKSKPRSAFFSDLTEG